MEARGAHGTPLLLALLLLLAGWAGWTGAVEDADADAADLALLLGPDQPPAREEAAPLCPTWAGHLQCDAGRCLRYEDRVDGSSGLCGRHCVEPAPTCLHRQYVCDGVPDCEDGADEARCVQCSLGAFPCDGVCRRRELICDPAYRYSRVDVTACNKGPSTF